MLTDIDRYLAKSARVDTREIDWSEAERVGLTDDETFVLTYFADVENQSLRYLRSLLGMKVALRPDMAAFLATWNYEEFFHGYELEQLMRRCGRSVRGDGRVRRLRASRVNETVESLAIPLLSRLFEADFPAVYMTFGALQELTTLRGYERLGELTSNPALRLLCQRIAKQERRHFAFYMNQARAMLSGSRTAQRLTRTLLRWNWVPVGAGVHSDAEVARLFSLLFHPRPRAREMVRSVDGQMAELPGLTGLRLMESYFERARLL